MADDRHLENHYHVREMSSDFDDIL